MISHQILCQSLQIDSTIFYKELHAYPHKYQVYYGYLHFKPRLINRILCIKYFIMYQLLLYLSITYGMEHQDGVDIDSCSIKHKCTLCPHICIKDTHYVMYTVILILYYSLIHCLTSITFHYALIVSQFFRTITTISMYPLMISPVSLHLYVTLYFTSDFTFWQSSFGHYTRELYIAFVYIYDSLASLSNVILLLIALLYTYVIYI